MGNELLRRRAKSAMIPGSLALLLGLSLCAVDRRVWALNGWTPSEWLQNAVMFIGGTAAVVLAFGFEQRVLRKPVPYFARPEFAGPLFLEMMAIGVAKLPPSCVGMVCMYLYTVFIALAWTSARIAACR